MRMKGAKIKIELNLLVKKIVVVLFCHTNT